MFIHPHEKREFNRLSHRVSPKKTIVAVAHRSPVLVWPATAKRMADTEANAEKVASQLNGWCGRLGEEGRGGSPRASLPGGRRVGLHSLDESEGGKRTGGSATGMQNVAAGFTGDKDVATTTSGCAERPRIPGRRVATSPGKQPRK